MERTGEIVTPERTCRHTLKKKSVYGTEAPGTEMGTQMECGIAVYGRVCEKLKASFSLR